MTMDRRYGGSPLANQWAPPAPAADPVQPAMSDSDLMGIINGDVLPFYEATLNQMWEFAREPVPQRAQYPTDDEFYNALEDYDAIGTLDERNDALFKAMAQYTNAKKLVSGQVEGQDGQFITQEMINSPDPYVAAQAKAAYDSMITSTVNDYNSLVNQMGLDQYTIDRTATADENTRRLQEFDAKLSSFREQADWDTLNVSRAADAVNRELSGMQESRARADLETRAALDAAPWATTPGKTNFTAEDFGGGVAQIARQGGIAPDASLVNFPTTLTIDPGALMAQRDAALGVGQGPLPLIPELTTNPGMIPQASPLLPGPTPPRLVGPQAPGGGMPPPPPTGGGGPPAAALPLLAALEEQRRRQAAMLIPQPGSPYVGGV